MDEPNLIKLTVHLSYLCSEMLLCVTICLVSFCRPKERGGRLSDLPYRETRTLFSSQLRNFMQIS